MMQRIIIHWTGGGHHPNGTDRRHYHFLLDGAGAVHPGRHAPEANARIDRPADSATYAAHTRGANTGSIGVALCAMRGAQESPFDPGDQPVTPAQVDALVQLVADLCRRYRIAVTPVTVLTHAEVGANLGVRQRGKWDITWLPGLAQPVDAPLIGDDLRRRVQAALQPPPPPRAPVPLPPEGGWWELIRNILNLWRPR